MSRRKPELVEQLDDNFVAITLRLKMPAPFLDKIQQMSEEREMRKAPLIVELAMLGAQSLRHEPLRLEDHIRQGGATQHDSGYGYET